MIRMGGECFQVNSLFCAAPWRAVPSRMTKAPSSRIATRPNLSQAMAHSGRAANWPMFWIAFNLACQTPEDFEARRHSHP